MEMAKDRLKNNEPRHEYAIWLLAVLRHVDLATESQIESSSFHVGRAADSSMKVRDMSKLLEEVGWYLVRKRGSHRQYRHSSKVGR